MLATTANDHSDRQRLEQFTSDFLAVVKPVCKATDPASSSQLLRTLIRSDVLKMTDMRDDPRKFFLAHRLLSTVGLSGFGIRFTVQFNLFAGSILGLGGADQVAMLQQIQQKGQLGCFLLTEMQAGVLSGLIVETTADWDSEAKEFVLHTPSDAAAKNWISQGYTAELGVVVARLRIGGVDHGPHPFFMRLRDETGKLVKGIRIEDMGTKTVANDLDNARVWFDKVRLPKDAILNKFADVSDTGEYVQVTGERMRIEVIGQRLLTGRLAIAEAALVCARVLHMKAEAYANKKICNGLAGEVKLAQMPQVRQVFEQSYKELDAMAAFAAGVEEQLNVHLINGTIPDPALVDAISVAKIRCIDTSLQRLTALRQEMGSYALMHDTGFALADMLLCCKFAEGDSRILQQKLTRDRLKSLKEEGMAATALKALNPLGAEGAEARLALKLAAALAPSGRDRVKLAAAMDEQWTDIYALADLVATRVVTTHPQSRFPEPMVERMTPADTAFDSDWKHKL